MEVYPAYIAWLTGKPAYMVYSREESMTVSTPRHESQIRVVLGASKDGHIRGIFLDSLWNAGAYGEHTPTTVTLSAISRFLYTMQPKPSASAIPASIPIPLQPALIAVTVRLRGCSPWKRPSTNWLRLCT